MDVCWTKVTRASQKELFLTACMCGKSGLCCQSGSCNLYTSVPKSVAFSGHSFVIDKKVMILNVIMFWSIFYSVLTETE